MKSPKITMSLLDLCNLLFEQKELAIESVKTIEFKNNMSQDDIKEAIGSKIIKAKIPEDVRTLLKYL